MELKVAERLMLMNLLAPIEGDITALRLVRSLQVNLGFNEEETATLEFNQETPGRVAWKQEADVPTEIEIGPAAKAIIATQLKKASATKSLSLQQLDLYEKFVEDDKEAPVE
jgi:hypothetical protein